MKRKRARLAGIGILALVMSVTVGLVSGSVADAKKKKKKGGNTFTITKTTPTAIPLTPVGGDAPVIKVPIGSITSKKFNGKQISFKGISVTTTFTGAPGFASAVGALLIGPTGRTAGLGSPFPNHFTPAPSETSSGPTTETPNSPASPCVGITGPPAHPPCPNPDSTLTSPYAGTIGNVALLALSGVSPKGTWFIRLSNGSTTTFATLNSITVTGNLIKSFPTK